MKSLEGRTALVSGPLDAVGRAVALALAARGVRIVVAGPDEKVLGETVGEIVYGGGKARHLAGDPADAGHARAAVARAVDTFEGLDFLVADVGADVGTARELDGASDLEQRVGRANARAEEVSLMRVNCTFSAALPVLRSEGRLIVTCAQNVGAAGHEGVRGEDAAGQAIDRGVLRFVRSVAREVAGRSITCNAIVVPAEAAFQAEVDVRRLEAGGASALRMPTPEDVAELVLYLCGRSAGVISGQAFFLGGQV